MKVLLIYPEFPDTFWSFKHALKFIHKKAAQPPLGLLTVGAMLPEEWSKRLVDLNVTKLTEKDLEWADMAFISAMVVQRTSVDQIIKRCKKAGVKTVAGGPLFTGEFEQFEDVDYLILNEAELTLPPFLEALQAGNPERIYSTTSFADIRQTPVPAWELLDMHSYAAMSLQFSRGCPFNCEFCNVTTLFGHRPRVKDAQQIIDELDTLYRLGWRDRTFFVDDNFIGNKRYLKKELLPRLIQWRQGKKGMPFNTEASLNLSDDPQLMEMMVKAGFNTVFIGIETPDEGSLAECNKIQNKNRNLVQCIKKIQRAGLEVQGGFIVGFDHDTPSIFRRQVEFIQKAGIVTAMVGMLQAPVGTRLYERLKKEGRLLGSMSGNTDGTTNIIPRMDAALLSKGYRYIMDKIYSPKYYYQRIQVFFKEYKKPSITPRITIPLNFRYLLAFFRANFQLGLVGKGRFHYWRIFFWTLLHKPGLLPQAVTFAVYGYHFRKVAKLS